MAPLYNTCQQKQQPNPHSHPHYLALNLERPPQPQMCMSPERIYRYRVRARLGRRPVAKQTPAHATRSRAHMPAFTHNRTNGNPYPYLSAPKNTPAPLAVVSTQARLCYRAVSYPLVTCGYANTCSPSALCCVHHEHLFGCVLSRLGLRTYVRFVRCA